MWFLVSQGCQTGALFLPQSDTISYYKEFWVIFFAESENNHIFERAWSSKINVTYSLLQFNAVAASLTKTDKSTPQMEAKRDPIPVKWKKKTCKICTEKW